MSSTPLVRRGKRNAGYTAIANTLIDHPDLSVDARLLLIYLLSKPEDWELQIQDLRRFLGTGSKPCGKNKTYIVLRELKTSAHVVDVKLTDQRGQFERILYIVHDEPHPDPDQLRREVQGESERSSPTRVAHGETQALLLETPFTEKREVDGTPFPEKREPGKGDITKEGKKQSTESPLPSPSEHRNGRPAFEDLWNPWPQRERPEKRPYAQRMFDRLTATEQIAAIEHAEAYRRREKGIGAIGLMITYLKQKLWQEFAGGPPVDSVGYFVVTPDRPEWDSWIEAIRVEHGETIAANQARFGKLLRHARWPIPVSDQASRNTSRARNQGGL